MSYRNLKIDLPAMALFLATVIIRLVWNNLTGYIADDAFITFRFAENIAAGNGFVYTIGERVLGTTTPLYTLLLAVLIRLGFDAPTEALVISLLAAGGTAALLYRLARHLRFGSLAWLPAVLFILFPRLMPTDTGGMETALFTLFLTAVFYYQARRLPVEALIMATLATLTRPEGLYLLVLLIVVQWVRCRDVLLRWIAVPLVLIGSWVMFAWLYFGSPLPHAIPAKLALYAHFGTMSVWDSLVFIMAWHTPFGVALSLAAAAGLVLLMYRKDIGLLEPLWLLGTIAFYAAGRTHLFLWYVTPIIPLLLLLACAFAVPVINRLRWYRDHPVAAGLVLGLIVVAVFAAPNRHTVESFRERQETLNDVHRRIGIFLAEKTDPGDVVAAEDIGYIGYISGAAMLDRDGLVSPVAVPYNRRTEYLKLILDEQPEWVVAALGSPISPFLDDPAFTGRFAEVARFSSGPETTYVVCQRRTALFTP